MITVPLSYPLTDQVLQQHVRTQVMAIGQFDGLHMGHQSVIRRAISLARCQQCPVSVMTFHPHPKEVMKKGDYEGYLTPVVEKKVLLKSMGVDVLYVMEFNKAFSLVTPQQFVEDVLFQLQVQTAVIGFDFRFGHRGEGDERMLRELGGARMTVETVPPFQLNGEKVSSSGIRKALREGNLAHASDWLGRSYRLQGIVSDGEKRGRTIGFPTANLRLNDNYVVPVNGVYAVRATVDDEQLPGVMNVGVKPTFHENALQPSFEVHLFDFDRHIYGELMTVELEHFIRPERKFDGVQQLVEQIRHDANIARQLLSFSRL